MQVNMMNAGGEGVLAGVSLRTRSEDGAAAAQAPDPSSLSVSASSLVKKLPTIKAHEPSRYVKGMMTSLGVAEQMRNAAMAGGLSLLDKANNLSNLQSASGKADWESEYVHAIHQQHEVEELARIEKSDKTVKASKRNLKEVREDIERAAEGETPGKPRTEADAAKEKNGTDVAADENRDEETQAGEQPEEAATGKTESLLETLHRVREERSVLTRAVASRAYAAEAVAAGQAPEGLTQAEPGVDIEA